VYQNISGNRGIWIVCLLLIAALLCPPVNAAPPEKPNFVIIFIDDLGYGDLGCFGATHVKTPRLDRMAEEGRRFTSFYVAASVCTPSRAALMTGSYPHRVSLPKVLFPHVLPEGQLNGQAWGINANEITVAEILKEQGYATGIVGKWHLGNQPEYLPTRHGFDEYFGLPYSNDMIPVNGRKPYPPLPLIRNEEIIEYEPDQQYLTKQYTEEAVSFIRKNKDQPFFLYLPHTMVHRPLYAQPETTARHGLTQQEATVDNSIYDARDFMFAASMEEVDWSVGEVLDVLKAEGLDEKTLVIFTSDNGPAVGSAGGLRGRKGSMFEGGLREPTIMWMPGTIPAGTDCNEMTLSMDILPTFAGLSGGKVPTDRVIDGMDIWPLIAGEAGATTPHETFFYTRYSQGLIAVRSGDWKLFVRNVGKDVPRGTLYNLKDDLAETTDVSKQNKDVVLRLFHLAAAFAHELEVNTRPPGLSPVIPLQ
jgi:arylsulfatase A